MHIKDASIRHIIASYAGRRAVVAPVRKALSRLGYSVVPATADRPFDDSQAKTTLRLVDERQLDRIPGREEDPETPIVTLVGSRPLSLDDPRIVGSVSRPANLLALYRVLQSALEKHPRRVPRVTTQLPARCIRSDHRWPGAVLSLSEGGCMLHSSERIPTGTKLNVQIGLPGRGLVSARARCVHESGTDTSLAFLETTRDARSTLSGFVAEQLAS